MLDRLSRSAAQLCSNPLWGEALWLATTFRWHPSGAAPPVMGLIFGNWQKGVELFQTWIDLWGNTDEEDAIRVAIIEGDVPGQAAGYTVRISPAFDADGDEAGPDAPLGQVMRMHPLAEGPAMLPTFKAEYLKHGEFLLAPVVLQDDQQLWFDVNHGIVKRQLVLRHVSEIDEHDRDAAALRATAGSGLLPQTGGANDLLS